MWKKIKELPKDLTSEVPLIIITRNNWIHSAFYQKNCSLGEIFDLEDCGGEWIPRENVKYWCYKEEFLTSVFNEVEK